MEAVCVLTIPSHLLPCQMSVFLYILWPGLPVLPSGRGFEKKGPV